MGILEKHYSSSLSSHVSRLLTVDQGKRPFADDIFTDDEETVRLGKLRYKVNKESKI